MKISLGSLKYILMGALLISDASAQLLSSSTNSSMDQYADQSQGNYQPMNLNYAGFSSLGMIQSAWQDPLQNLGEGQSKPAYSKYYWTSDLVLPIRLREAMITLVNFPEWELIENIYIGDNKSFAGQISGPNTILLYPQAGTTVGVDTNIIVFGRSGNKYVFYVKSEGVNTERLTNSIIDIDVVGDGTSGGSPSSSGVLSAGSSRHINANNYTGGSPKSVDSTFTKRFLKEDWLKSIPLDPTKFRFDIEIYVPNPDDVVIAPERVWHDDIFTYIDLGEKALNMIQRPIVTLIVERSETPVGFRTKGPNNRLIIVEGVGDMVMRSGKRMVCLKLRRSDDVDSSYISYADDSDSWDVAPKIPGNKGSSGGKSSSNTDKSGKGGVSGTTGADGSMVYQNNQTAGTNGSATAGGNNGLVNNNGVYMPGSGLSGESIDYSNMHRIDRSNGTGMQNPFPQYKYGSGFSGDSMESLSIELGTDANVNNLESLWKDLSGRYSSLLNGYEPFYSVDTPADGQGKELFHLRVGPIKSLDSGDAICSQLGRNGVFCSVIRMQ
ncbi:MAG: TrbG/VirB9 family P-type conjugative transfer protein [Alphaproteobacteria bacterium]|nr:TrbG/VirB9 family P-type conjugative transfer protein [Alphaproteobacteria bacterium]